MGGINADRSGMVWEWLRVIGEMDTPPAVLVAENVLGLVSTNGGDYYVALHNAFAALGYSAGCVVLDARHWLPQSRMRIFVVAVADRHSIPMRLQSAEPEWCHNSAIQNVASRVHNFIYWRLPEPPQRDIALHDIIDLATPTDANQERDAKLALVPVSHMERLQLAPGTIFPGYKRMRNGQQVLELRFDGIAGCLRTAGGGSSRQELVIRQNGQLSTRLLTTREAARLMGVRETFQLPEQYNVAYTAMGDAVAVPAVRYLARHLLTPLCRSIYGPPPV